ncbi:MAG: hypothetical protein ACAI25_03420 [Planctomycetota bacterium]
MSRLVLVGRVSSRAFEAFGVIALAGVVVSVLVDQDVLPWLGFLAREKRFAAVLSASLFVALIVAYAVWRRAKSFAAQVVLGDSDVLFVRGHARLSVRYEWLAGYTDELPDIIELVRKPRAPSSPAFLRLSVPTPDEQGRLALLALLASKGLKRLG